jgi:RNA polymerase sigma-70 factor (ECF subfamily)
MISRAENWILRQSDKGISSERAVNPSLQRDEKLVALAQNGDFTAFEELVKRYRVRMANYALQMLRVPEDVEDVVQDSFQKAYENIHRYKAKAKFSTWLTQIVKNQCRDHMRKLSRRASLEQREATGALTWMTQNSTADPAAQAEDQDLRNLLHTALGRLSDAHREAIVFRDLMEREYNEIGEHFGCTAGGAKLRVLRARRALEEEVRKLQKEWGL